MKGPRLPRRPCRTPTPTPNISHALHTTHSAPPHLTHHRDPPPGVSTLEATAWPAHIQTRLSRPVLESRFASSCRDSTSRPIISVRSLGDSIKQLSEVCEVARSVSRLPAVTRGDCRLPACCSMARLPNLLAQLLHSMARSIMSHVSLNCCMAWRGCRTSSRVSSMARCITAWWSVSCFVLAGCMLLATITS